MIQSNILLFIFLLAAKNPVVSNTNNFNKHPHLVCAVININHNADAILGKWMTVEHNLEIEVYKQDNNFHAKIIWFKIEDTTRPMNTRMDEKNPNPELRTRKWLGMEVLRDLKYNEEDNEWEDGIIYDAKHGREWDSVAWINSQGLLKVKGYWVFRWISETLAFKRVP
jgi:uncharacterized protein (DUF2147 family)